LTRWWLERLKAPLPARAELAVLNTAHASDYDLVLLARSIVLGRAPELNA
jgi:hypothetical protein